MNSANESKNHEKHLLSIKTCSTRIYCLNSTKLKMCDIWSQHLFLEYVLKKHETMPLDHTINNTPFLPLDSSQRLFMQGLCKAFIPTKKMT